METSEAVGFTPCVWKQAEPELLTVGSEARQRQECEEDWGELSLGVTPGPSENWVN